MSEINYAEVLLDLYRRMDKLRAIASGIEELMGREAPARPDPEPEKKPAKKRKTARDFDEFLERKQKAQPSKAPASPNTPTISDAIRQAAMEGAKTSFQIADRCKSFGPAPTAIASAR